jgi:3-methylcrotonyl-CoA carboxylase alpha subunit
MFQSVLIANRGKIARRIIKTAKRMGIRTIAVYSEPDAAALHVSEADHACCIGPAAAADSYLNLEKILAAARESGAEAIHPGCGFLSENADFAAASERAGLIFIGPAPDVIRTMGEKSAAKILMQEIGVPVIPGYHGDDQDGATLADAAEKIGYPVLIKAVAGGGGRGMRAVTEPAEFTAALGAARREAAAAFGDDRMVIEKQINRARHIEVQVFADIQGNAVHLFERDCSIQRRYQKVIEEAPASGIAEPLRAAMHADGVRIAKAIGYRNAGTIEFIVEAEDYYFLEMNTRL